MAAPTGNASGMSVVPTGSLLPRALADIAAAALAGSPSGGDASAAVVTPTGGTTARTLSAWIGDSANPIAFGADPTGAADSTAAFTNACAALGNEGKIILPPATAFLLSSGWTVPHGIIVEGSSSIGEALPDGTWGPPVIGGRFDYHNRGSVLILPRSQTITLRNRAALRNLYIMPATMLRGATSDAAAAGELASFSGTAIAVGGSDVLVENVWVWGYNTAITCDSFERPTFSHVVGDCLNGINLSNCTDTARISACEFMPFWTTGHNTNLTSTTNMFRSGAAFVVGPNADGTWINENISYGYAVGLHVNNTGGVFVNNFWADNVISNAVSGATVGISVTGTIETANFFDNITILEMLTGFDANFTGANNALAIGSILIGVDTTPTGCALMQLRAGSSGTVGQFRGSTGSGISTKGVFNVGSGVGTWNFSSVFLSTVASGTTVWKIAAADIPNIFVGNICYDAGFAGTDALGVRVRTATIGAEQANSVAIYGAPSGSAPEIAASCLSDASANLKIAGFGTGAVQFLSNKLGIGGLMDVEGSGAPNGSTQGAIITNSRYWRTDGTTGSRLYFSTGAGSWVASSL